MNMEKNIVAEEVNAEFLKGFIYCVRGVRVMLWIWIWPRSMDIALRTLTAR